MGGPIRRRLTGERVAGFQPDDVEWGAYCQEERTMTQIHIEHDPSPMKLEIIGVYDWPIWTKEISKFPWTYDQKETCYILEGEVIVTPDGGEPVKIVENDYVSFPEGMSCTWDILSPVKKHYNFG